MSEQKLPISQLDEYSGSVSGLYTVVSKQNAAGNPQSYKASLTFLQSAADAANTQAAEAKSQAESASKAAAKATASATGADTAAANAEAATSKANTAAGKADAAAASATDAAATASAAATSATSAAEKATTAAGNVDTAISKANTAASNADAAASAANTATAEVTANEDERKAAEQTRKSNEESRQAAETKRASAESARESAETKRESNTATAITNAEKATTDATTAATATQTAIINAETATAKANAAADRVDESISKANTAASNADDAASAANTAAENADAATSKATTATTNADTATTKATAAATTATTAADKADKAREAIEKEDAVLTSHPQTLTDAQQLQARENIGAEFLHRALGKYDSIGEKTLSVGTSGKYIDVNGSEVSNSAYAISAPISLNKGDDLLIPSASPVAAAVSVVSRKVTNTYDEPIIYDIAYDGDKVSTATAQYDKTLVYTAVYEDDTLTGWTMGGTSYDALPATHSVTRSFYVPLVNQSVAAMPDTGYYVFPADEAMEVVISAFTATVSGGVCKVYGVGLIKNNATNMVGQTKQHVLAEVIADLYARLDSLEKMLSGEIGSLTVGKLTVRRAIEGADIEGGKDLRGAGAPSASVLPEKWDAETYGEWLGIPQFIGQTYDDTTNKIAYRAEGVTSVSDWRRITNA